MIEQIFDYWKQVHDSPRSRLDKDRIKAINSALAMGYTIEELTLAIEGCWHSKFHMGDNDRDTKYNSITLIFRNADHIDKFIELGIKGREKMARKLEERQKTKVDMPAFVKTEKSQKTLLELKVLLKNNT